MTTQDVQSRKLYRVSPLRRAVLLAILGLIALSYVFVMIFESDPASRKAAGAVVITLIAIGLGTYPLVHYPHLLITSDGIEVRQIGWSVATPWDNVIGIEIGRGKEGLILREPLSGRGARAVQSGLLFPGWYTPEQIGLVKEGRWIPLAPFGWWLRHGELERDLRQYLPGLFSQSADEGNDL